MQETNKLNFTELVYGVIVEPKTTFRRIAQTKPLFYSFLILVSVNLLTNLANFLIADPFSQMPPNMPKEIVNFIAVFSSPSVAMVGAFLSTVFAIVLWFLFSAFIQLISEFFGGRGTGIGVMTMLGYSTLPQVLGIPFLIIFNIAGLPAAWFLINIPLTIWSQLILPILGLREVQQFSLGRAVLVFLAPIVLFFGLMVIVFMGFISLVLPFLR